MFKGLNEAEQYFENTEDIINEEDLEESVCESRRQSPLKQNESKATDLDNLASKLSEMQTEKESDS